MADPQTTPILPAHIEDTVQAIARFHAEHHDRATPLERMIEGLTARAGSPKFIGLLTVAVVAWISLNVTLSLSGHAPLDEPPFYWMQGVVGLAALYMTSLILTTQRRDDQLASLREQLTLELGILSEQKAAKIIELLEEMRRDDPHIRNRLDPEAVAMSNPCRPPGGARSHQGDARRVAIALAGRKRGRAVLRTQPSVRTASSVMSAEARSALIQTSGLS